MDGSNTNNSASDGNNKCFMTYFIGVGAPSMLFSSKWSPRSAPSLVRAVVRRAGS